jgi:hypothetical protein
MEAIDLDPIVVSQPSDLLSQACADRDGVVGCVQGAGRLFIAIEQVGDPHGGARTRELCLKQRTGLGFVDQSRPWFGGDALEAHTYQAGRNVGSHAGGIGDGREGRVVHQVLQWSAQQDRRFAIQVLGRVGTDRRDVRVRT